MSIPVHVYMITISLIAALVMVSTQKRTEGYLKAFPFLLLVTIGIEVLTANQSQSGTHTNGLYNYVSMLQIVFYILILRQFLTNKKIRAAGFVCAILYPIACIYNINFIQVTTFHSMTYSPGCLIIVALCIGYFYELFTLPKSTVLFREPAFWICTGLLFFYTCTFPIFVSANLLQSLAPSSLVILQHTITVVNISLYSLFTIAFLCRIRIRKFMLS